MLNNTTIMEINQQQKDFMEANRPHYVTLIQAEFLTNIGYDVKEGLLNIARVFDPGYQANLWCGPCVCDLVKYTYTQYDKWVAEQPIAVWVDIADEPSVEIVKDVVFDDPIIQKATFPKHDKPELAGDEITGVFVGEVKDLNAITNNEWNALTANVKSEDTVIEIKRSGKGRGGKSKKK